MDLIRIFDTTLRDGEQAPGFSMSAPEKIRIARQLESLGVDVIEAGFPIASRGDLEGVRAVACEIHNCTVAALARAKRDDIDVVLDASSARHALQPLRDPLEQLQLVQLLKGIAVPVARTDVLDQCNDGNGRGEAFS